ncbi:uracil-DNA glycosylase family protein [Halorussus halobius]|uniref:uracil-DNA glycosylase family protein n=1 Tax=Halorussus halobius TaxID=1710537 RepID=UPI001091DFF8|nr:uracil-DNA glycosylase family protein [Halorussus halobius]
MKNVTDRISNPFGMRPPCAADASADGGSATQGDASATPGVSAVHGYGDANADFHLVGDHPGVHGGRETGVPFTGSAAGERLQSVLREVGLLGDADGDAPAVENLFMSYRHACPLPGDRAPTDREYDDMERFFDAELRAIAAHVLLPVGEPATRHVLRTYAAREALLDREGMAGLHAEHVPGRGFLIVPIREPSEWDDGDQTHGGDRERLVASLSDLLASDYRQTADLSRFVATEDTYEVR